MLVCPGCGGRLNRVGTSDGAVFACSACGGRAVSIYVLNKTAGADVVRRIRNKSTAVPSAYFHRKCPHCTGAMVGVHVPAGAGEIELDVCNPCRMVWFDNNEYNRIAAVNALDELAQKSKDSPYSFDATDELSLKAREMLAKRKIRLEDFKRNSVESAGPEGLQWIPAILGLPLELDAVKPVKKPIVTWTLCISMIALFALLWQTKSLEAAITKFGFVPDDWARYGGLTLITSFFLHAGWYHVLGNMYFLLTFGDNCEDTLGRWRFIGLLLLSHVCGMLLHLLFDPRGDIPCVGASAGIAGVIAYYAMAYPRARLGILFWVWLVPAWIRLKAWSALVLYILLQVVGILMQVHGLSHVSYLAHGGGLAVGILVGLTSARRTGAKKY